MIERSWLVEADVGQMCAKSAHVQNLHTCEHALIRSALGQVLFYWGGSSDAGIASKASHLDVRQVRRAGDPA
jgi:hypothetical protein